MPPPCLPPNRHKFSKAVRLLLPLLPPATLSLATLRNCDLSWRRDRRSKGEGKGSRAKKAMGGRSVVGICAMRKASVRFFVFFFCLDVMPLNGEEEGNGELMQQGRGIGRGSQRSDKKQRPDRYQDFFRQLDSEKGEEGGRRNVRQLFTYLWVLLQWENFFASSSLQNDKSLFLERGGGRGHLSLSSPSPTCFVCFSLFFLPPSVECEMPASPFLLLGGFRVAVARFLFFPLGRPQKRGRENKRGRKDVRIHQFFLAVPKCRGCSLLPAGEFPSPCRLADFLFPSFPSPAYYPAFHSAAARIAPTTTSSSSRFRTNVKMAI